MLWHCGCALSENEMILSNSAVVEQLTHDPKLEPPPAQVKNSKLVFMKLLV
jgi:hypothetical protein